jgi:hypothetical protein
MCLDTLYDFGMREHVIWDIKGFPTLQHTLQLQSSGLVSVKGVGRACI